MAVGSRALKEARLDSMRKRRKKRDKVIPDLSVTENLEPEFLNLTQEMPMEEQILSRIDKKGEELAPPDATFNSNFADDIPESVRDKIAAYLEEVTEKDTKNRAPWLDIIEKAKTLLGFKIEEIQDPNNVKSKSNSSIGNAAQVKTYDTTFSSSVLRLWATLRSELLPSTGPVGFKIPSYFDRPLNENESNRLTPNEDYELKGEMVRDALNEYLTVEDKGFYPDYDRFLLYLILYGCVFRKIYYDSITGKPLSRFIMPEDFLFDNNCSSITESNRLTHIRYLSKREILFNMQSGIFSKVDLDYLDSVGSSDSEEATDDLKPKQVDPTNSRFPFYETHEYLVLNDFLTITIHLRTIVSHYLTLLPDAAAVIRSYHLRQTGMKMIQPKQGLTASFIIIYSPGLMFLDWGLLKYLALIQRV